MLTSRTLSVRKNTVKKPLTPGGWLLARYQRGKNVDPGCRESVSVQPLFTFKPVMDAGQAMRVTASDYADTGRWWL
jgi:ribosomal protein L34E